MSIPYQSAILDASHKYGVPPNILAGLLAHESGFNPTATNHDSNGTVDRGIAQLNSAYYPSSLASNPTQAIYKAASILHQHFGQCGSWSGAVGAYNLGHCGPNPSYVAAVMAQAHKYETLGSNSVPVGVHVQTSTTQPRSSSAGSGAASGNGSRGSASSSFWRWLHDHTGWLIAPGVILMFMGLWVLLREKPTVKVEMKGEAQ